MIDPGLSTAGKLKGKYPGKEEGRLLLEQSVERKGGEENPLGGRKRKFKVILEA